MCTMCLDHFVQSTQAKPNCYFYTGQIVANFHIFPYDVHVIKMKTNDIGVCDGDDACKTK